MFTTQRLTLALVAALPLAAISATDASAKPRRVAVMEFDGPRTLADNSRATVISLLGTKYDLIAAKRWTDAKALVNRTTHGPASWSKAAKQAGVDAVIEGYINEEGRSKVLTLLVTDASDGSQKDELTLRIPTKGLTDDVRANLLQELEDRFEWIEPVGGNAPAPYDAYEPGTKDKKGGKKHSTTKRGDGVTDRHGIGKTDRDDDEAADDSDEPRPTRKQTKKRDRRVADADAETTDQDSEVSEKKPPAKTEVVVAAADDAKASKETALVANSVFGTVPEEIRILEPQTARISRPTPHAEVWGGLAYGSRSLSITAEDPGAVDNFESVPNPGFTIGAAYYPWPKQKRDGGLQGLGFSFELGKSLGGSVSVALDDRSVEFNINEYSWNGAIHYRHPLSESFTIDGEVGYGQQHYQLTDPPEEYEVPDVGYEFLSAGGSLDLKITDRSKVGFGAKYLYMLGTGNLNDSGDFVGYGPGTAWGLAADAHFVIPLPKSMFVRGDISYFRVSSTFDGVGSTIAEDAGVTDASDSIVRGSLKLGIEF